MMKPRTLREIFNDFEVKVNKVNVLLDRILKDTEGDFVEVKKWYEHEDYKNKTR